MNQASKKLPMQGLAKIRSLVVVLFWGEGFFPIHHFKKMVKTNIGGGGGVSAPGLLEIRGTILGCPNYLGMSLVRVTEHTP